VKIRGTDPPKDEATPGATALIGRDRDLADARAVVEAGLAGAGGALLVTGEAGVGKTRLVEELAARAPVDTCVLWGVCWSDPGTPAYWPWRNVVRDGAATLGVDAGDNLAPILGVTGSTSGPTDQLRLRLFDAAATFLRRAGRVRPLLVVLEDLHLADGESLDLLRFLAADLRGQPVVLVGTYRYPDLDPGTPRAAAVAEFARAARPVSLIGLDERHVAELVHATRGSAPSPELAARIHERTGGNPLFVIEIAKLLAAGGDVDADHLQLPPSVQQVISQRLGRVRRDALDLLALAAVSGLVFSEAVLRKVTHAEHGKIADLLDEAIAAGLVRRTPTLGEFGFTHAIVRDVLYAGMPAALRRTRHRQTAEAIEHLHSRDLDAHLGELADHHVLALPDTDAGRALDFSRRAGHDALGRLAYAEAARHLARAVDLAEGADLDEAARVELLLTLGDARLRSGDWHSATRAYEAVAASARRRHQPEELARAALGLGAGLSGFEVRLFDQRQLDLLREALVELGEDESELRTWLLARLSVAESFEVAEVVRTAHSLEALGAARRAGDSKLLAYALSSYCDAVSGPAHTEERLTLASEMVQLGVEAGDPESELLGRRFRLVALLESGDLTGVDAEVEAFERTAARLRWPLVEWYPVAWRGMRALIEGRLDQAQRLADAAREIGERGGSVNAGIVADLLRVQWLLEQRRPGDVYELLGRFVDDPEGGPNAEAWLALPLALMGRQVEARGILDRLTATGFPLVMDAAWLEVIASVAEACAALSHSEAAATLMPLLEPYADRFATGGLGAVCFGSLSRHLGLLAHCTGRFDDADAYFRHALDVHRRSGAVLLVAHTLGQYAALLIDRDHPGDRVEAEAMLAEAGETYRELGLDHRVRLPAVARTVAVQRNRFLREGDVWAVGFGGRAARVRHVKGMLVLARLLAEPGREFHVLDLAAVEGVAPGTVAWGDTGDVIDAQARDAYRRRLAELETDLDEASATGDLARADRAQREREGIVEQLTAAYGLGGRVRRGNDPVERARSTVTKQVRAAIGRIESAHPELALHLTNSVRTGRYCSYAPEAPSTWEL